jgi:hypothetical protein
MSGYDWIEVRDFYYLLLVHHCYCMIELFFRLFLAADFVPHHFYLILKLFQ